MTRFIVGIWVLFYSYRCLIKSYWPTSYVLLANDLNSTPFISRHLHLHYYYRLLLLKRRSLMIGYLYRIGSQEGSPAYPPALRVKLIYNMCFWIHYLLFILFNLRAYLQLDMGPYFHYTLLSKVSQSKPHAALDTYIRYLKQSQDTSPLSPI